MRDGQAGETVAGLKLRGVEESVVVLEAGAGSYTFALSLR